jgi:hypothetical protein
MRNGGVELDYGRLPMYFTVVAEKRSGRELDSIAEAMRGTFQDLLKSHVKDKSDLERLSGVLGVSVSLIKKMLYEGEGGLDIWAKAFAHLYELDKSGLQTLQNELRRKKPISESDKIWFSIRDELGATEENLHYLAACAREAFRIKTELDQLKKRRHK